MIVIFSRWKSAWPVDIVQENCFHPLFCISSIHFCHPSRDFQVIFSVVYEDLVGGVE